MQESSGLFCVPLFDQILGVFLSPDSVDSDQRGGAPVPWDGGARRHSNGGVRGSRQICRGGRAGGGRRAGADE